MNDHFIQLVSRNLAGEASAEERRELEGLLREDPQAHYFYEIFSTYWTVDSRKVVNPLQQEIHFQQILAIAEKEKPGQGSFGDESLPIRKPGKIILIKKLAVAALLAGVITSSYFLFLQTQKPQKEIAVNEIEAKKGTRSFMQLPDGTKVWLNSDSKLEYNTEFNQNMREVSLTGEAYFDVVKDAAHPFVVHTSDIDIRVLGTAFNVKSYPRESFIEATLIHGLIEVTNKNQPASKMLLRPHEKLVFHKQEPPQPATMQDKPVVNKIYSIAPLKNVPDTARVETSWVYNKMILDGETFKEVALKMERWYNVSIIFKDEKIELYKPHYIIDNETVEEVLKNLQITFRFQYKIDGNEIEIY
jgi:transmembrane sensor